MASIHDDFLRELAYKLADGEQFQVICPECTKRGFSLKREAGRLLYHCFKAGCGFSGRVLLTGHSSLASQAQAVPQEERLTPYGGLLQFLSPPLEDKLSKRFGINVGTLRKYVARAPAHYLMPINAPSGSKRGMVLRVPWEGTEIGEYQVFGPKSHIFKEKPEPMLSWYYPADDMPGSTPVEVILVEDQMSAIKLADCGYTACALLGTSLNSEKISEIQGVSKHIVIALDSDATSTAFKLARKWQSAFSSCRVVILESDVKDMPREKIRDKFG